VPAATILFICTGNTCRSPLAEAIARRRWGDRREFASAGLQAVSGQPASEGSALVAAELGADLATHSSQPLDPVLLRRADWVIGMTRSHVAIFRARYGGTYTGRLGLLGQPGVDLAATATVAGEEVADPFGGAADDYRAVGRQIDRLLDGWEPVWFGAGPPAGGDT